MNLRPRDQDKELGPPSFRYGAKTGIERVYDTLSQRNNSMMDNSDILNKSKVKKLKYNLDYTSS